VKVKLPPGTYTLEIQLNECVVNSNEFEVEMIELPVVDDGSIIDVDVCFGDRGQLMTSLDSIQVDWFLNGEFFTTDFNILLLEPGIYHFEYSIGPCSARSPDFNVTITELPSLDNLPELIELCIGDEIALAGPDGIDTYSWTRDGEIISTEQELQISEAGIYQLETTLDQCFKVSNEIEVIVIDLPPIESVSSDIFVCDESSVSLLFINLNYDSVFLAREGEVIDTIDEIIIFTESGE